MEIVPTYKQMPGFCLACFVLFVVVVVAIVLSFVFVCLNEDKF